MEVTTDLIEDEVLELVEDTNTCLSIDIGIRNLSLCVMSSIDLVDLQNYKIKLWDVYDTLDDCDKLCKGVIKSGRVCGKKCGYKYKEDNIDIFSCKTHCNKSKKVLVYKKKAIANYLLQDIAKIVLAKFQEIYDNNIDIFKSIDTIVIELQPKINSKMVFISHIIYGRLVELYRETKTTVRFVRAATKLKAYTGSYIECKLKSPYAKRKWLSVQYTEWFLKNKFCIEQKNVWLPIFETKTVKPDMGDTFLMAINSLHGIPKKK